MKYDVLASEITARREFSERSVLIKPATSHCSCVGGVREGLDNMTIQAMTFTEMQDLNLLP